MATIATVISRISLYTLLENYFKGKYYNTWSKPYCFCSLGIAGRFETFVAKFLSPEALLEPSCWEG
jgi:hypothetical protein